MEYTLLPIERIKEWEVNRRLRAITEENYLKLKSKLELKPQFKPLIVTPDTDGTYITLAGNHRLKAYNDLGVPELWVEIIEFVQDGQGLWHAQQRGTMLPETFITKEDAMLDWSMVDNEEAAYYDREMVINEMDQYNIDWSNYSLNMESPLSVPKMLEKFGLDATVTEDDVDVTEDEAPEVSDEPAKSELGKVYQLGRHRLMCGDAYRDDDVISLLGGAKVDAVVTDPPYGIAYKSPSGKGEADRGNYDVIKGDTQPFDPSCLFGYCDLIVSWGANHYANKLPVSAGWLVWDKREGDAINNNSDCELAWVSKGGSARLFHHKWNGMIKASERDQQRQHPTQKPIALSAWVLKTIEAGDNILDLFGGSGSTLIACEQTNRTCYMMELDTKYVDVIRKRYHKFTNDNNEEGWEEATPGV